MYGFEQSHFEYKKLDVDAAPFESARLPAAELDANKCYSRRRRRRGPRSNDAVVRRSQKRLCGAPAGTAIGESMADVPIQNSVNEQPFVIYCINIRCLLAHLSELCHYVSIYDPALILIQETWLNSSIENVVIPNYKVLSRRDRSENENRGGVITYVRNDIHVMVHMLKSPESERLWHFLHLDIGTIAISNWYRPPVCADSHIQEFDAEIVSFKDDVISYIVMGNMNIISDG